MCANRIWRGVTIEWSIFCNQLRLAHYNSTWTNHLNMMAIIAVVFIEHAKLTVKKNNNRQLHIFHLSFFVINWKQEENNSPSTRTTTYVHLLWCSLRFSSLCMLYLHYFPCKLHCIVVSSSYLCNFFYSYIFSELFRKTMY